MKLGPFQIARSGSVKGLKSTLGRPGLNIAQSALVGVIYSIDLGGVSTRCLGTPNRWASESSEYERTGWVGSEGV